MTKLTLTNNLFKPNLFEEIILPSGQKVKIPKCNFVFKEWKGEPIKETFGGKALIDVDGKPMFAELAIMHLFIKSGWQARWIETYATSDKKPKILSEWKDDKYKNQIIASIADEVVTRRLAQIAALNGSYSGCWDVLGWNGDKIIFAESKRFKKDRIQGTQVRWLDAGLHSRLTPENFLIVQWDFE